MSVSDTIAELCCSAGFRRMVEQGLCPSPAFEQAMNNIVRKHGPDGTLLRSLRDGTTPFAAMREGVLPVTDPQNPLEAYLFCSLVRNFETSREQMRSAEAFARHGYYFRGAPALAFLHLAERPELKDTVLGNMASYAATLRDGRHHNIFVNTIRAA